MAGVVAACAARRRGADVVLVRKAMGATALSSGAVDAAPPHLREDGSLEDSVSRCVRDVARAPNHPFAVLAAQRSRLDEAIRFASELTSGLIAPAAERLRFFPTALGTLKAALTAQSSQVKSALSELPAVVGVVGFRGAPTIIDAAFVAKGLQADARSLGASTRFVPVESRFFNQLDDASRQPFELAARFDAADAADMLAAELARVDAAAFLFPAIMGLFAPVTAALSAALGRPCAEMLADAHGSVPGLRLQRALDAALLRHDVRVVEGAAAVDGGVVRVGEEPLAHACVVLASGKFIGGGVRRDGALAETVFGAPVFVSERRGPAAAIAELLGERYTDDQAVFRAGVRIDEELRVLGADGRPVNPKLFAAGSVITGFDLWSDGGGLGLSIFTGLLAGERAAAA